VANTRPIIVTEGISDIIYLKYAIKSRAEFFPSLVTRGEGKPILNVSFLNPSRTSRSILDLGNGATGQNKLINEFGNRLKRYRATSSEHPVIILCDNDEGPKEVFSSAGKKVNMTIHKNTTEPFYHLGNKLYLVKVPEGDGKEDLDIETLFPVDILNTIIGGKKFDKKKEHEDHNAYGKVFFAEKVVPKNKDFSGFDELLSRISACIVDYKTKIIPALPS
jgi:hypothetical protein